MVFHGGTFKAALTSNALSTGMEKELTKLTEKQAAEPAPSKGSPTLQGAAMNLCLELKLFHETWAYAVHCKNKFKLSHL